MCINIYLVVGKSIRCDPLEDLRDFFAGVIVDYAQKARGDICVHLGYCKDILLYVENLSI